MESACKSYAFTLGGCNGVFHDGAFHDSIVFRVYTYFSMLTLVPQRPCVHPRLHWVHAEVH